jgi:hypothetical protein
LIHGNPIIIFCHDNLIFSVDARLEKEKIDILFLDIYLILNENDANIIISRNMCQYGGFLSFEYGRRVMSHYKKKQAKKPK